jgi:polyisoprenoid-binding protein YceI
MVERKTIVVAPTLTAGTWALDTAHSAANFAIRHLGIALVRGRFVEFGAELVVGTGAEDFAVSASIPLAAIDTGNSARDEHLHALLDVANRPTLAYRSTGLTGEGSSWTVAGELTIGEVTKPVPLNVTLGGVAPFFDGTTHAGFTATATISRADFGLDFGQADAMVGDQVDIELNLECIEPK